MKFTFSLPLLLCVLSYAFHLDPPPPPQVDPGDICASVGPTDLGGTVWLDANNNGVQDEMPLEGIANIRVFVYDCADNLVGQTFTNVDGDWLIDASGAASCGGCSDLRVEFGIPVIFSGVLAQTIAGPDNGTISQFTTAGNCGLNYALRNVFDCPSEDAQLAVVCFTPRFNNDPVIVSWPAAGGSSSTDPNDYYQPDVKPVKVDVSDVGTVWGIAYDKFRQRLFTGSFIRTGTRMTSSSLGNIYIVDNAPNQGNTADVTGAELWVDLNAPEYFNGGLGQYLGTDDLSDGLDDERFRKVGKAGFGDLDMNSNGSILYAVDLANRRVLALPVADDNSPPPLSDIDIFPIPTLPGCDEAAGDTLRPFGLEVARGRIYVGCVCDASGTKDVNNLNAAVFSLTAASGFLNTPVLSFNLGYPRESVWTNPGPREGIPGFTDGAWKPWLNDDLEADRITTFGNPKYSPTGGMNIYPTPVIADLDFLNDNMIIGLADRTADQMEYIGPGTSKNPLVFQSMDSVTQMSTLAAGDLLIAGFNGVTWDIENGGSVGGNSPRTSAGPGVPGSGPGGREYFFEDGYPGGGHYETQTGAVEVLPWSNQVAAPGWDPYRVIPGEFGTGGAFLTNEDGSWDRSYALYGNSVPGGPANFGKGNSFGDIETIFPSPELQIGNYLWIDEDMDGVQDACEPPLAGIPITLFDGDGNALSTTTTDADGEYYFGLAEGIVLRGDYTIAYGYDPALAEQPYDPASGELTLPGDRIYTLTQANTGQGIAAGGDINDSDATLSTDAAAPFNGFPTFVITDLLRSGHAIDVGFTPAVYDLALRKSIDPGFSAVDYMIGDPIEFLIDVFNQGTGTVRNVGIIDQVPCALLFDPTSPTNAGWTAGSLPGTFLTTITDPIPPGESVQLRIGVTFEGLANSTCPNPPPPDLIVNRAEIFAFENLAGSQPQDVDSTPDQNPFNDGGGRVNDASDNILTGDGTGAFGSNDPATDEDDQDPATLVYLDLALYKVVDEAASPPPFTIGDIVKFDIGLINQSTIPVSSIVVTDLLPPGLAFDPAFGDNATFGWVPGAVPDEVVLDYDILGETGDSLRFFDTVFVSIWLAPEPLETTAGDPDYTNLAELTATRFNAPGGMIFPVTVTADGDSEFSLGRGGDTGGGVGTDDDNETLELEPGQDIDSQDPALVDLIDNLSLGSTVFLDLENNGVQNGDDAGIADVPVLLFSAGPDGLAGTADDEQVLAGPDGEVGTSDDGPEPVLTDADGNYLFTGLTIDEYFVRIPAAAFAEGAPLNVVNTSSNTESNTFAGEVDPDEGNVDGDDNGLQVAPGTVVNSGVILLSNGAEPTGTAEGTSGGTQDDALVDANGNMTLDFGFFAPVTISDVIFVDQNNNGIREDGEPGISGGLVYLINSVGDTVDGRVVLSDGSYTFGPQPPGAYSVAVDLSGTDGNAIFAFTLADAGTDETRDNDVVGDPNDPLRGTSASSTFLFSGESRRLLTVGVRCDISLTTEIDDRTSCLADTLFLSADLITVMPDSVIDNGFLRPLGATYSSSGDGSFVDRTGMVLDTADYLLTIGYLPGPMDVQSGSVTILLSTEDPSNFDPPAEACEPETDEFTITVLQVDCGEFFWSGGSGGE